MNPYWWGNTKKCLFCLLHLPQTQPREIQNTTAAGHFKFPMGHSRFGKWISLSFFHLRDKISFSHGLYVFSLDQSSSFRQVTASSVAKNPIKKIISTWGTPLELHSDYVTHFV